jgi:hypothetical protein
MKALDQLLWLHNYTSVLNWDVMEHQPKEQLAQVLLLLMQLVAIKNEHIKNSSPIEPVLSCLQKGKMPVNRPGL